MDLELKLEKQARENLLAINDMHFKREYSFIDQINEISLWATKYNCKSIVKNISKYNKSDNDRHQYITVYNKYIDALLKRYAFEVANKGINLNFDVISLDKLSLEETNNAIEKLEQCFKKVLASPSGSYLLLSIKSKGNGLEISAKPDKKREIELWKAEEEEDIL